jgi:hypothetical protein
VTNKVEKGAIPSFVPLRLMSSTRLSGFVSGLRLLLYPRKVKMKLRSNTCYFTGAPLWISLNGWGLMQISKFKGKRSRSSTRYKPSARKLVNYGLTMELPLYMWPTPALIQEGAGYDDQKNEQDKNDTCSCEAASYCAHENSSSYDCTDALAMDHVCAVLWRVNLPNVCRSTVSYARRPSPHGPMPGCILFGREKHS